MVYITLVATENLSISVMLACGAGSIFLWQMLLLVQRCLRTTAPCSKRTPAIFFFEVMLVIILSLFASALATQISTSAEQKGIQMGYLTFNANDEYDGRCSLADKGVQDVVFLAPLVEEAASRFPLALLSNATTSWATGIPIAIFSFAGSVKWMIHRPDENLDWHMALIMLLIVLLLVQYQTNFKVTVTKYITCLSIFMSAFIFSIIHIFNYMSAPLVLVPLLVWPQFITGLMFSTLTLRYGLVGGIGGIVTHMLFNYAVLVSKCI